ncbi:hypothetical protein NPIL_53651 [Nephila pilipes]|uniref:Uncharacterized protein n=1 Tax=Nephila pilipes TaxID=299642 RepID=A0A8X6PEI7_NEPPI|nr:hypothetical protein NPIL_53651 [Nephila pilipes]
MEGPANTNNTSSLAYHFDETLGLPEASEKKLINNHIFQITSSIRLTTPVDSWKFKIREISPARNKSTEPSNGSRGQTSQQSNFPNHTEKSANLYFLWFLSLTLHIASGQPPPTNPWKRNSATTCSLSCLSLMKTSPLTQAFLLEELAGVIENQGEPRSG